MLVIGEALFYRQDGGSVGDIIRHIEGELPKHVNDYDDRRFDSQTDEEVTQALTRDLTIVAISIDEDKAEKKVEETQVAVNDFFSGGLVNVDGLRLTKTIPFIGDRELWGWGTRQWGSVMPRGDVRGKSITIGMEVRASEGDTAAKHITSTVTQINDYLARQKAQIDPFNAKLPSRILPLVKARRERRGSAQSLLDKF